MNSSFKAWLGIYKLNRQRRLDEQKIGLDKVEAPSLDEIDPGEAQSFSFDVNGEEEEKELVYVTCEDVSVGDDESSSEGLEDVLDDESFFTDELAEKTVLSRNTREDKSIQAKPQPKG
jgi:hypothetical protein